MLPMKDGERRAKRKRAAAEEKHLRGPFGHKEVGCATLIFYDRFGERLRTVRQARMPESKKATLKEMLSQELSKILEERPDLKLVKIASCRRASARCDCSGVRRDESEVPVSVREAAACVTS
jgi:hypothetical protein